MGRWHPHPYVYAGHRVSDADLRPGHQGTKLVTPSLTAALSPDGGG